MRRAANHRILGLRVRVTDTIPRSDVRRGLVYLRRWTLLSVAIGIAAGLGALALILGIDFFTRVFLGTISGYTPPIAGVSTHSLSVIVIKRPWLIPVSTTLGGLVSGLIVTRLAPEAKGIGTDAAIGAFHKEHALIRWRVPLVKLLTSAITIGSGGTSGREGPIAQIGAGAGSQLAKALRLTEHERAIALAAGLGAGIAAIFKAPLAGGILSGEVFYKHDFEAEALIPGFIASTVSYSIVGFATGWQPIFSSSLHIFRYIHPEVLPLYALLGLLCAASAHLLFYVFYNLRRLFDRLHVPEFTKPAIGGLAVGTIGIFVPSVLGVGYGWAQIAINQDYQLFPVTLMILAIFAEIFAMSFTLGSGGSGGIFGPCVVTGGLIGATFGYYAEQMFPLTVTNSSNFAIVGMMAFFGAAAKSPLAVIVMVAEMTGGYDLLAPSMLTVVVAYLLSGSTSIFANQVGSLEDSPGHAEEYETLVLKRIRVSDVMTRNVQALGPNANLQIAQDLMDIDHVGGLPVVSGGKLIGIITRTDILKVEPSSRTEKTVSSAMSDKLAVAYPDEDLFSALTKMITRSVGRLPVVDPENTEAIAGIITRTDIGRAIDQSRSTRS
jgi:CIC family chloride channel protein